MRSHQNIYIYIQWQRANTDSKVEIKTMIWGANKGQIHAWQSDNTPWPTLVSVTPSVHVENRNLQFSLVHPVLQTVQPTPPGWVKNGKHVKVDQDSRTGWDKACVCTLVLGDRFSQTRRDMSWNKASAIAKEAHLSVPAGSWSLTLSYEHPLCHPRNEVTWRVDL